MKINMNTRIDCESIVLVPYREKHVPKYHAWMSSPQLQHLTGSEPLTMEQEYDMQKSWQEDEKKCTFVVLDRRHFLIFGQETGSTVDFRIAIENEIKFGTVVDHGKRRIRSNFQKATENQKKYIRIGAMIGDTNLYFNDNDEPHTAECEIMIAEESARGRKFGTTAMMLMLRYGIEILKVDKYRAKIKLDNPTSIGMFTKLGFNEVSKSEVFQETTMEKQVDDEWREWLMQATLGYQIDDNWMDNPNPRDPYHTVGCDPLAEDD